VPYLLAFILGVLWLYARQLFPLGSTLALLAALPWLLRKGRLLLLVPLLLGVGYALLRGGPPELPRKPQTLVLEATASVALPSEERYSQVLYPRDKGLPPLRVWLKEPLRQDRLYRLKLRLLPAPRRANPGWVPRRPRAELREVLGEGPAGLLQRARAEANRLIMEHFPPEQAAVLMAITTGERLLLTEEHWEMFSRAGLAHLLSISATHFAFLGLLVSALLRGLLWLLPLGWLERLTLRLSPWQLAALLSLPVALGYLMLSGARVPTIRAFVMTTLLLAGMLLGRERAWLRALGVAALVLVLWQPWVLLGLSFQMSFLAVLFIGFVLKGRSYRWSLPGYAKASLLITLAATVGLAPLVAYHFHHVSLISPVANLLITPVVGLLVLPLSLGSVGLSLFTGAPLLSAPVVKPLMGGCLSGTRALASLPFSSLSVPSYPPVLLFTFYIFSVLWFVRRRRLLLALAVVPLLLYALYVWASPRGLSITFLDVGHGKAAVLELPDGQSLVVDTGRTGKEVLQYLRHQGKRQVWALALSHGHPDHAGGVRRLLRAIRVREIWDNGRLLYQGQLLQHIPKRHLQRGDTLQGPGYSIQTLHPYEGFFTLYGDHYTAQNNDSLVLRVASSGASVLLTGDIEAEAQEDLLHLGPVLRSRVLDVPHHGSRTAADWAFLLSIRPEVAVISVGRNRHNHPHPETLQALRATGARLYRTDQDGAVKVIFREGSIKVKTYRDFYPRKARSPVQELRNLRFLLSTW
jgi:competence protein ComEC